MQTDALLYSIRRWLVAITFLLSMLVLSATAGDPWTLLAQLVAFGFAIVSGLFLWETFRGDSDRTIGTDPEGENQG
ncbi:hypothetical protein [Haloarchaeobius amylolyticus]|uniref:hypothetical protein n=1 Tax=Haloarchaeobius amylolyticus TaxID=1198296 RepID=UPI00226FD13A|nr:hypothetical protein [Haloarchaeobius amylolyticus]